MGNLSRALDLIDAISVWSGRVLAYLVFPLIGVLVSGVIARYIFHTPIIWAHEVSRFIFGGLGVLLGAYVFQKGAHIKMDIVYNRLSLRGRAVVDVITALIFFSFIIILMWEGGHFALHSIAVREHSGSLWHPPVYPFKTAIPIAAFLVLLQGLAKFIRDFLFAIRGKVVL